jgi:hypothetical protein
MKEQYGGLVINMEGGASTGIVCQF